MSKKKCLYTVVVNNYDFTFPPIKPDSNVDYILFTDNLNLKIKGWNVRSIDSALLAEFGLSKTNRYYKFFPHKFLADYDVSIYIDGSIRIIGSLKNLFQDFLTSDSEIGLLKHPLRETVSEEVEACIERNKVKSAEKLRGEYLLYLTDGFLDKQGMTENGVIIRLHNSPKVIEAMELWWAYLATSAGRDQISFPFVRQQMQLNEKIYEFNARVDNPYFRLYSHKTREPLRDFGTYLHAKGLTSFFYKTLARIYTGVFGYASRALRLLKLRK
jgi:hypothetical protein